MEEINIQWLTRKERPDPTQVPCRHWVFATDGWDLKIDVPTATKLALSIDRQFPGQMLGLPNMEGPDWTLRRTFKVLSGREVEFVLTRPAAKVIVDAVLGRDVGGSVAAPGQ